MTLNPLSLVAVEQHPLEESISDESTHPLTTLFSDTVDNTSSSEEEPVPFLFSYCPAEILGEILNFAGIQATGRFCQVSKRGKSHADAQLQRENPLIYAVRERNHERARALLASGSPTNRIPLIDGKRLLEQAAANLDVDMISLLCSKGIFEDADLFSEHANALEFLKSKEQANQEGCLSYKELINHKQKALLLLASIYANKYDIVLEILNTRVDLQHLYDVLLIAAQKGHLQIVHALCEKLHITRCDVNPWVIILRIAEQIAANQDKPSIVNRYENILACILRLIHLNIGPKAYRTNAFNIASLPEQYKTYSWFQERFATLKEAGVLPTIGFENLR